MIKNIEEYDQYIKFLNQKMEKAEQIKDYQAKVLIRAELRGARNAAAIFKRIIEYDYTPCIRT
jgi:hypothetical protein